jgi:hypothetical protein
MNTGDYLLYRIRGGNLSSPIGGHQRGVGTFLTLAQQLSRRVAARFSQAA